MYMAGNTFFGVSQGVPVYFGYGGKNESMNTEEAAGWYNRDSVGTFFDMPALYLRCAYWMNPYAQIDGMPTLNGNTIDLFIYHKYGNNFNMRNTLRIWINDVQVCSAAWPLSGSDQQPRNQFIKEHVCTLQVPSQFAGQLVTVKLELIACGAGAKEDWYFEGISAI